MALIGNDGIIRAEDWSQDAPNWSIIVGGDWAPNAGHVTTVQKSPEGLYGDLLPLIQGADLSIVNLEAVLTDGGTPIIKDGPPLKAAPEMIKGLSAVPFDVACLANNHILDYGQAGLQETIDTVQANGMAAIGAGMTLDEARKPFSKIVGGARVAVLNVAEGEEGLSRGGAGVAGFDLDYLRKAIPDLRKNHDTVIVIAHGGRENIAFPPPYIQTIYRAMIEMGADMVIGHHPHVPQGVEVYKNGLIAYSLGNFAFYYAQIYLWAKLGYMVKVNFAGAKVHSAEIIPYRIVADGLTLLKPEERDGFFKRLNEFSDYLTDAEKSRDLWAAYADLAYAGQIQTEIMESSALILPPAELAKATRLSLGNVPGVTAKIARRGLVVLEKLLRSQAGNPDSKRKGAAILHNRFETLAHRELYLTIMERMARDEMGSAPKWALDVIQQWYQQGGF